MKRLKEKKEGTKKAVGRQGGRREMGSGKLSKILGNIIDTLIRAE